MAGYAEKALFDDVSRWAATLLRGGEKTRTSFLNPLGEIEVLRKRSQNPYSACPMQWQGVKHALSIDFLVLLTSMTSAAGGKNLTIDPDGGWARLEDLEAALGRSRYKDLPVEFLRRDSGRLLVVWVVCTCQTSSDMVFLAMSDLDQTCTDLCCAGKSSKRVSTTEHRRAAE